MDRFFDRIKCLSHPKICLQPCNYINEWIVDQQRKDIHHIKFELKIPSLENPFLCIQVNMPTVFYSKFTDTEIKLIATPNSTQHKVG